MTTTRKATIDAQNTVHERLEAEYRSEFAQSLDGHLSLGETGPDERPAEGAAYMLLAIFHRALLVLPLQEGETKGPKHAISIPQPADWTRAQIAAWIRAHRADLEAIAGAMRIGVYPDGSERPGVSAEHLDAWRRIHASSEVLKAR